MGDRRMARNRVQFQKGLSMAAFNQRYGTEEQCEAALGQHASTLSSGTIVM